MSIRSTMTEDQLEALPVCILAAPVLGGNSGTWATRRRSLKPEGLKIEAEGRGRGGVLGEGASNFGTF